MKTFFVAVALLAAVLVAADAKIKCFKDDAIVHDEENFGQCISICKEKNSFKGEITPEIYECMLDHFTVVKDGEVNKSDLKALVQKVANADALPALIDALDNKCADTAVKAFAKCLDENLESQCNDGE